MALFELHDISNHIVELYKNIYRSTDSNSIRIDQYILSNNVSYLDPLLSEGLDKIELNQNLKNI